MTLDILAQQILAQIYKQSQEHTRKSLQFNETLISLIFISFKTLSLFRRTCKTAEVLPNLERFSLKTVTQWKFAYASYNGIAVR